MVYEITERTMSADGQLFMIPDVEINMYWTSLDVSDEDVIELYHNHAVCEQFHSEIKPIWELKDCQAANLKRTL